MEINRCYGCMKQKKQSVCEYCGWDEANQNASHQLPTGTVLKEQYLIGKVLGQGGFGITYLGWDLYLDIPVAIKEYYPNGAVMREASMTLDVSDCGGEVGVRFRNNKERFLREAKMLARFSQVPEIVQVKNFFQANNTAYIVMEYVEGINLKQYVKKRGGKLSVQETFSILEPVMQALCKVHKTGLVHRDISPDNIMMLPNGGAKLLDFGAVRDVSMADPDSPLSQSTEAILKQGYAPIEQYQNRGSLGPWTDVYALCATIYFCLTGQVPPDAPERLLSDEPPLRLREQARELTAHQESVLEKGMALRANRRYASMDELCAELFQKEQPPLTQVSEPVPSPAKPKHSRHAFSWKQAAIGVLSVAALILIIVILVTNSGKDGATLSGSCGDALTYSLNLETGEMVISGTGPMYDFYTTDQYENNGIDTTGRIPLPWENNRNDITSLTIGDGVITIGSSAFLDCENLRSIQWGSSLENIYCFSFSGCSSLTELDLPEGVRYLDDFAFYVNNLVRVTLPDSLKGMLPGSFGSCPDMEYIYIGPNTVLPIDESYNQWFMLEDGVPSKKLTIYGHIGSDAERIANHMGIPFVDVSGQILTGTCGADAQWELNLTTGKMVISGTGAMDDYYIEQYSATACCARTVGPQPWYDHRDSITSLVIGDEITYIGECAFADCANLKDVTFGESVEHIDCHAFRGTGVKSLDLPDSLCMTHSFAFSETPLQEVTLPEGVGFLGGSFAFCPELRSVSVGKNCNLWFNRFDYGSYNFCDEDGLISDEFTLYGYSNTMAECYAITNGIPFESIGTDYWDAEGQCGDNVYWHLDKETLFLYIEGEGDMWDFNGDWQYEAGHMEPDPNRSLAPWFSYKMYVETVCIGEGVTSISENAFAHCERLTYVSIPDTVCSIGFQSFLGTNIGDLVLPESVTYIAPYAFNACENLYYVVLPYSLQSLEEAVFNCCINLTEIFIGPNTSLYDAEYTPFNHEGEPEMPKNLNIHSVPGSLAEHFAMKHLLSFSNGIRGYWGEADGRCGDNVYWMKSGDVLYLYGTGETWFFRSEHPFEEKHADWFVNDDPGFYEYRNEIKHICIMPGVTHLNYHLFCDMPNLASVDFGTVESARFSFVNCGIEEVLLPQTLTHVGEWLFQNCYALRKVTILNGSSYTGEGLFAGCSALEEVWFNGLEAIGENDLFGEDHGDFDTSVMKRVTFYVKPGSSALRYARENHIKFKFTEQ